MELKAPTKEQVLEAADSCPEAKRALEKLFPDAFKVNKLTPGTLLRGRQSGAVYMVTEDNQVVRVIVGGRHSAAVGLFALKGGERIKSEEIPTTGKMTGYELLSDVKLELSDSNGGVPCNGRTNPLDDR